MRLSPRRSLTWQPNWRATSLCTASIVIGCVYGRGQDVLERLAGDLEGDLAWVIEAKLTTRRSAPTSSRMLVETRLAMYSSDLGLVDREAVDLDLAAQDGDARLDVGAADVDDDALAKARAQAVVQLLELARLAGPR